jgi:hypothetical protein
MFLRSLSEIQEIQKVKERETLFEHEIYKRVANTMCSYRQDSANTASMTQKHVHVYAKACGKGKELYSVNQDGSGHDGYSGIEIPREHADFFRKKGFEINANNILESLNLDNLDPEKYELIYLDDNH